MDYCSTESELIESLDYLTLPVKRSNSFAKVGNVCGEHSTRPGLVRDYTKKVSHKTQTSHSLHKFNDSIILNSTKEEIIEYYAFVSPTENTPSSKFLAYLQAAEIANQIKDQSLIKVTVAPKIIKPYKPNIFNRRKQNNKNIHNTASDEEHFLQGRNVYLVVSEQKRERLYNIKTTESAKLLNNNNNKTNDDISLGQLKDVKQIIHSLNMDKKRKKEGPVPVRKEKRRTGSPAKVKVAAKKEGKKNKTDYEDKTKEDSNQAPSILRITTQVGLDQNNQLQMRCGVEGRKGSHLAPANVEFKSDPDPYFPKTQTLLHTVNQSTQIEMADIHNSKVPYYSEGVACFCQNMKDRNNFDNSLENHHQTEGHQSPLVVITVYPKNERCQSVKIYKRCGHFSPANTYENTCEGHADVNVMQETYHYSTEDKNDLHGVDTEFPDNSGWRQSRPRSVSRILRETEIVNRRVYDRPKSPLRSTSSSESKLKRHETKTKDTIKPAPKAKTNNFSRSPRSQSPNKNSVKNIKQKGSDKNIPRKNKNEIKKLKESPKSLSPRSQSRRRLSPSSRSPSIHSDRNILVKRENNDNQRKKGTELKQQDFKIQAKNEDVTKPINLTAMGTNTDHTWTKKALVDAFTKEVLGQMEKKKKDKKPRENESQVAISINGDNENYNVLFQQARRTTDLRVRKTVKRSSPSRSYHPNVMKEETSMANLLEDQNVRVTNYGREETVVPEIKVRDSLEIGHKRQQSSRMSLANMDFPDLQTNLSDTDSFAPVKHYTGDNCPIPDPIKRDKEIRQLLGIEKKSKSSPPLLHFETMARGGPCHYRQEDSRKKKELKKQSPETQKTHQINFQVSPNKKSVGAQYEPQNVSDSPSAKKVILNRNIQVFLEIEKFTEQKPIVLSRKQYLKVKKAIENATFRRSKQKLMKVKCSAGAFIDVKKKEKIVTDTINQTKDRINYSDRLNSMFAYKDKPVLFATEFKHKKDGSGGSGDVRVSYSGHINESSTKVTVGSAYSHSIHTIFRGFKKSHTPNFGTSTCSLYSDNSNEFHETSVKYFNTPLEKPKKPFLRRLMSCLVLRASTASGVKIAVPPKRLASCNSCTVDSYLLNTSLAALEMSSSIYDTSESFYSNHSILPINKIKRSFLGSVRGLLSYGKN